MPLWFWQSVVAMLLLVPAWLAIPFFERNYHVPGQVFLVWYMPGMYLGVLAWCMDQQHLRSAIWPGAGVACALALVGLLCGAVANVTLFGAVGNAPNPGVPVAIANVACLGVFAASVLLPKVLPKYFKVVSAEPLQLFGVVLVIAGAAFIAAGGKK